MVVINAIAFMSSVYMSYDAWITERKKDWDTPLPKLFFTPLCVFIMLAWPFSKYRKYHKELRLKEERKRHHFQQFYCLFMGEFLLVASS